MSKIFSPVWSVSNRLSLLLALMLLGLISLTLFDSPKPAKAEALENTTNAVNKGTIKLLPTSARVATTIDNSRPKLIGNGATPIPGTSSSTKIDLGLNNALVPPNTTGLLGILTNVNCESGGNLRFWANGAAPQISHLNVPGSSLNIPGAKYALNLSTNFVTPVINNAFYLGWSGGIGKSCGYVVDLVGYVVPPLDGAYRMTFLPLPTRIASGLGANKLVGNGGMPQPTDSSSRLITVSAQNGIPLGAKGVIGTLTNVECESGGNLRFWTGNLVPNAANLNVPGSSLGIPNAQYAVNLSSGFIAPLDANGKLYLGWSAPAGKKCGFHLDVTGYIDNSEQGKNLYLLPNTVRVETTINTAAPLLLSSGAKPVANTPNSVWIWVGGKYGIVATPSGVMGSVTNVNCNSGGNFRFWKYGGAVPEVGNLNVPGSSMYIPSVSYALNLSTGFAVQTNYLGYFNMGWSSAAGKTAYFAD
jgi:hypothetical protein